MVFKPNLSSFFHVCILICVISIILLLFAGCSLFQRSQDIGEIQEESGNDSLESEVPSQEEEEIQEEIEEEKIDEETVQEEQGQIEVETEEKEALENETQEKFLSINVYYIDEQAQYIVGEAREISGRNEEEL